MRTIIAGSRGITDIDDVSKAISASGFQISTVISGTARGVDRLGEEWAVLMTIDIERYPAEWDKYGKSAGYRRNELMATKADALIAVWDGESRGTKHMIEVAKQYDLKVYVHNIKEEV